VPLGLRPDDDLDVTIEESDEVQQPFGGEPVQLVVLELAITRGVPIDSL
jgi:hypothetical protein